LNGEIEAGVPRDVAHQQQIAALGFRDERRVFLFRNVIEDFEGVIAGIGLLVDQAHRFLGGMAAVDDGTSSEDGRAKKFATRCVLSPEQVRRTPVQVKYRGDAIRKVERELNS